MLEDEFKTLLHRIALALGMAQSHPDPAAYADEVVTAHDSIIANAKAPAPVAGTPVLTDATEWAPPAVLEVPPAPVLAEQTIGQFPIVNVDQIHADTELAPIDSAVGTDGTAMPVEVKEDAGNVPAVDAPSVVDAATSTHTATTFSEHPVSAEGETPAAL